jgi:DNA-damage-inducible protein D
MSELTTSTSVFDALRRDDEHGSYWTGRDLMVALGYDKWERFEDAIERAIVAAVNSGQPDAFSRVREEGTGGRPRTDYRMSRYGAYLLAMNGDPRKTEIAAAQSYFAIKTREAETGTSAVVAPFPEIGPAFLRQIAEAMEAKDQKIAELEPVAGKLLNADGDLSVADAAEALTRAGVKVGAGRLFTLLSSMHWIYRDKGDNRWRVYQTAIEGGWMSVLPQSHYHPKTGVLVLDPPQPRVTPKGIKRLLCDHGADVSTSVEIVESLAGAR